MIDERGYQSFVQMLNAFETIPQGSHKNQVLDFPITPILAKGRPRFVIHADQVTWRGSDTEAGPSSFVAMTDT